MKPGKLFVISGPSGAGKGTLVREVLQRVPDLFLSISATTREPRPGERDGVEYYFIPVEDFRSKVDRGEFLEWARVYGNYYGTLKPKVEEQLRQGRDVVLEIDVQGAAQIKEQAGRDAVFVFVFPPSWEELERRLKDRGTEAADVRRVRLEIAREEIKVADQFDHVIINDKLEDAAGELAAIIERYRDDATETK